jgi:hypothetical protein
MPAPKTENPWNCRNSKGFLYNDDYNTRRVQRNLGVLTPMEKHGLSPAA